MDTTQIPITGQGSPAYPALHGVGPVPQDTTEAARWDETRRRRRIMGGTWREDLERRTTAHFGNVRREALGPISLATNLLKNICIESSVLYDTAPAVIHQLPGAAERLSEQLRLSGLWQIMQTVQPQVLACREYLVRVDVEPGRGALRYRPVPPDVVIARADPMQPDVPVAIDEIRPRLLAGGWAWCIDRLSVEDPEAPVYQVLRVDEHLEVVEDVSADVLGADMSGAAYPYRTREGRPVLPYVLYHAARPGDRLWDPWAMAELVEGTLDVAVIDQMIVHVIRDASWPQRWALGARPVGLGVVSDPSAPRAEVVTDPATLLMLEATADAQGQPQVGQWQPGGDPVALEEALTARITRIATEAGIPPSDVQRMGATARSGVAISLTNEGKRAQQRRYAAVFRDADERLLRVSAILLNRATNNDLPESGYGIVYREVPLSPAELEARRKHALELVQAGLMSKVEAYIEMHPGMTPEAARQELAAIDAEDEAEDAAEGEEDTGDTDTDAEVAAMLEELASESPDMEAVRASAEALRKRKAEEMAAEKADEMEGED